MDNLCGQRGVTLDSVPVSRPDPTRLCAPTELPAPGFRLPCIVLVLGKLRLRKARWPYEAWSEKQELTCWLGIAAYFMEMTRQFTDRLMKPL
jgi:hypothetical protein